MTNKFDLFGTLGKIDAKQLGLYDKLSEQERKQLHPLVIMRWLTGDNDITKLIMLNELVNPYVFSLSKHPQLLIDLMTVCTDGNKSRYGWKKVEKKQHKYSKCINVLQRYYQMSARQAKVTLPTLTNDTILQHALDIGFHSDDIKLLKKELKKRVDLQL